jgi:DNA recombination protein RmuC
VNEALAAIIGFVIGAGLVLVIQLVRRRAAGDLARQLLEQSAADRLQSLQTVVAEVQAAFARLSQEALKSSNEQFLQLAETRLSAQTKEGETALASRQKLIDETVKQIGGRLAEVTNTLQTLEKDRRETHGALVQKIENVNRTTTALQTTTAQLREALANPQRRGQWGERMAEDVLRLAGFIEGVNYVKQAANEVGRKPDFTFPLPQGRRVNMDVKFPLPNYLRSLDAPDETAAAQARTAFLRDVRARIKEVTGREYIDPAAGTVDYVLVFIPNEQVYGFIHEHDATLLDDALSQKVVLCSPLTLYALLAVIRQTAEQFRLEQTSQQILELLGAFSKEWRKYTDLMDRMGKALEQARDQYDTLTTTRTRKLERQLDKIDELRGQQDDALPAAADDDTAN